MRTKRRRYRQGRATGSRPSSDESQFGVQGLRPMYGKTLPLLVAVLILGLNGGAVLMADLAAARSGNDPALEAPAVDISPGPEYADETRAFQGIPGIERANNGRLWVVWYGGGPGEGPQNYVMAVTSGDDGATWTKPAVVIDPVGSVRAFDPCLWHDTLGRLWLFWAQAYHHWDGRAGVWAIRTEDSGIEHPVWSPPRRICNGIMMNKPTVLSTGEWLLPVAVWQLPPDFDDPRFTRNLGAVVGSNVYSSTDAGATFSLLGQAHVPEAAADEHMIVERKDASLWMLVRTRYGIGESISTDRGETWSPGAPSAISHIPTARFFIGRLESGKLLRVTHSPPDGKTRSHLMACLSNDDGTSWYGGLVVDERSQVSYPDAVESPDGTIYLVYDRNRRSDREILMAAFTEDDVVRARFSSASRQRVLVNQAGGKPAGQ